MHHLKYLRLYPVRYFKVTFCTISMYFCRNMILCAKAHLNGGHKQTKSLSFFFKFASILLCFESLTSIKIVSHGSLVTRPYIICIRKHGSCIVGLATVIINFKTRKISFISRNTYNNNRDISKSKGSTSNFL